MLVGTCTVCARPIHSLGYSGWYHDDWTVSHVAQPRIQHSTTTNPSTR